MTLFRWIAGSTTRLALFALGGIAAGILLAPPAAEFVRYASTSPVTNLLIKTAFAFAVLATATLLAILIGDRVFPGRWRERVILGRRVAPSAPDDTMEAVQGLKSYYLQFSVIIAALCIVGGVSVDRGTQLFSDSDYDRTTLRGDSVERKVAIIRELAEGRTEPDVHHAIELLDTVWRDERQPAEVREAALDALAEVVEYLVRSVETWLSEGRTDSWHGALVVDLRRTLAPDLRALHPTAPAPLRPYLSYLLGALQDVAANPLLEAELVAHPEEASREWRGALAGLGAARQSRLLPRIVSLLEAGRTDGAYVLVAWATKEAVRAFYRGHADPERAPEDEAEAIARATAFFVSELQTATPERRCIAAELLRFTGHAAARDPLLAAFDLPIARQTACAQARAEVPGGGDAWIGTVDESLQARIVQAIATLARGDARISAWVQDKRAAGGLDETVAALLEQLAAQR